VVEEFHRLGLKPRPGQVEAAQILATSMLEAATRERAAFIAPPGFGKTLTVLVALKLSKILPATWRVRAHTLTRHVAEQCSIIDLKPEVLLGRERVCPYAAKFGSDIHAWCAAARYRCPLFRSRTCRYYYYNIDSDVFIMNYARANAPPVPLTVWDEAHNLVAPREVCLSVQEVIDALSEVRDEDLRKELEEKLLYLSSSTTIDVPPVLLNSLYKEYVRILVESDKPTRLGRLYRVLSGQAVYTNEERDLCGARILLPRRGLLVSATLPGADKIASATLEIPWSRRLRAAIVPHITTRYSEFDEAMAERARTFLLKLLKKFSRITVFATQRVAKKLAPVASLYEPEDIPPDWRGVLLLHSRGRYSEGIDLKTDVIVVLGAPYLPPHASERLRRLMERLGIKHADELAMLNTTLQCVGRATRKPEDNPVVYLADYRFERFEDELSKYFEFAEELQL